nr:hypothetical transcript [Hymenolepis microstoma]
MASMAERPSSSAIALAADGFRRRPDFSSFASFYNVVLVFLNGLTSFQSNVVSGNGSNPFGPTTPPFHLGSLPPPSLHNHFGPPPFDSRGHLTLLCSGDKPPPLRHRPPFNSPTRLGSSDKDEKSRSRSEYLPLARTNYQHYRNCTTDTHRNGDPGAIDGGLSNSG